MGYRRLMIDILLGKLSVQEEVQKVEILTLF